MQCKCSGRGRYFYFYGVPVLGVRQCQVRSEIRIIILLQTYNNDEYIYKFFSQKHGENIEQYAFDLKRLASASEFKDITDGLINDKPDVRNTREHNQGSFVTRAGFDTEKIIENMHIL